jgi:hypothetical protein
LSWAGRAIAIAVVATCGVASGRLLRAGAGSWFEALHPIEVGEPALPSTGGITGAVHCATEPTGGARVCATEIASEWLDAARPVCVDADASGRFAVHGLRAGVYSLAAAASACVPDPANRRLVGLKAGAPAPSVDLTLVSGGAFIDGVVVDERGHPMKGAAVQWSRQTRPRFPMAVDTGADGRFRLPAPGGAASIAVTAKGYAPAQLVRRAPATDVVVRLAPESTVGGRALSAFDGRPLAHVVVHAVRGGGWASDRDPVGVSDETGEFRIDGLAAGSYALMAIGAGWRGVARSLLEVGAGEPLSDETVELVQVREVEGTVLRPDGTPCDEGQLLLDPVGNGPPLLGDPPVMPAAVHSDVPPMACGIGAGGHVRFGAVPPGVYHVSVQTPGAILEGPRLLEVGAVNVSGTVWRTAPGAGIVVHVVDALERPVPYGHVRLLGLRAPGAEGRAVVPLTTDPAGTYDLSGTLFPGTYRIEPAMGFSADPFEVDVQPASTSDVVLRLRGAASIVVAVRDTGGAPVDDIAVRAIAGPLSLPAESLGGGRFRVSPLEAGDYEIEAFDGVNVPARGSGPSGTTIAVPREGIVSAEAVVDRRATLEGRVVDAGGAPVKASVRVACESTGAERDLRRMAVLLGAGVKRGPVETGPDGHFAIGGVARDARCTVHAQAATAAGSTPEVRPGEQAVITVKPAAGGG